MKRATSVDDHFQNADLWQAEQRKLREIVKSTGLVEDLKWGGPCYSWRGKNIVGIGAFKSYFGLWFHQGALLDDDAGVLVNAQEGKTRAQRQWRMHTADDIKPNVIRRYIRQAKSHIEAGHEIKADRSKPVTVPGELTKALRKQKGATAAFRELRRGLQREYADYVTEAKRDDTKQRRIEKILPMILSGIGLNDKHR